MTYVEAKYCGRWSRGVLHSVQANGTAYVGLPNGVEITYGNWRLTDCFNRLERIEVCDPKHWRNGQEGQIIRVCTNQHGRQTGYLVAFNEHDEPQDHDWFASWQIQRIGIDTDALI
jgi:hypothetical protein